MRLALLLVLNLVLPSSIWAASITIGTQTYTVDSFPMPSVSDTSPLPLDIAYSCDGATVWMVPEFDKRIYSVSRTATAGTTMTQVEIQAPNAPLFRTTIGGVDNASSFSPQQEHIQTTCDGSVWVSQGGLIFYSGVKNNWSRIARRKSDGTWEAYTLGADAGGAVGFFVDDPPQRLWVMSAGMNALYYTRLSAWHDGENSATKYPPADMRWSLVRDFGLTWKFPAMLTQLKDRRFAGSLYFGTSFFLFNPDTVTFTDVKLSAIPSPCARCLLGSSGPWQIRQDANENLWIAEDYAQRVTKYNIFTGAQTVYDLRSGLSSDEGPHSIAFDDTTTWISTYPIASNGNGRLVKISAGGIVTYGPSFATISLEGGLTGITRTASGELWVAMFRKQQVIRIRDDSVSSFVFNPLTPTPTPTVTPTPTLSTTPTPTKTPSPTPTATPVCGNGIVETGESCDSTGNIGCTLGLMCLLNCTVCL